VVKFKFVVSRPGVAVDQWHPHRWRPVYSPIYTAWDDPIMARKFGGIILLDVMHKRPDEWRQIKNEDNSYEWVELNQYCRREHRKQTNTKAKTWVIDETDAEERAGSRAC
jgi:hypothetical protein